MTEEEKRKERLSGVLARFRPEQAAQVYFDANKAGRTREGEKKLKGADIGHCIGGGDLGHGKKFTCFTPCSKGCL